LLPPPPKKKNAFASYVNGPWLIVLTMVIYLIFTYMLSAAFIVFRTVLRSISMLTESM